MTFLQNDGIVTRSADVAELADAIDLGFNTVMMELADMQDLGSYAERRVGSSPTNRTELGFLFHLNEIKGLFICIKLRYSTFCYLLIALFFDSFN